MLLQHSTVLDKFIHFCTFFNSKSNNLECAQKSFLILHVSWYVYLIGTQMRSDKKYLPHVRQQIKSRTNKVHCFGFSVFWSSVVLGCRFFRIQQQSFIFALTCRLRDVDCGMFREEDCETVTETSVLLTTDVKIWCLLFLESFESHLKTIGFE